MCSEMRIVIGASGSLGSAVCQGYEERGLAFIGTSTKGKDNFHALNLGDRKSIEAFANKMESVNHLVIAAGRDPQQNLKDLSAEHLDAMISIHYSGPLWLIKLLQSKFTAKACITLVSSIAAYKGSYDPSYSSLKGAVNSLVKTLARELAPQVRVNAIAPGLIQDSPVFNRMTPDFRQKHLDASLTKTLLKSAEVAQMVLTIEKQINLNGQIIHLNGGQYYGG